MLAGDPPYFGPEIEAFVEICDQCGIVARSGTRRCALCDAPRQEGDLTAVEPAEQLYAVGVQASFQCRRCLKEAPIDAVADVVELTCHHCEFQQAFDVNTWREVLDLAHEVGDLSGSPEGRTPSPVWFGGANPHADVGVSRDLVTLEQDGHTTRGELKLPRVLRARLAPGHPLCDTCRRPVEFSREGEALVHRCAHCNTTQQHRTEPSIRKLQPALQGVIGDAHREAHEAPDGVQLAEGGRVGCASCGAPLDADGSSRIARCAFCGAITHIPLPTRHKLQAEPTAETLWLVFEGPSRRRRLLERDPSTWTHSPDGDHRDIHPLVIAPRPLGRVANLAVAYGLPGAALAMALVGVGVGVLFLGLGG